MSGAAAKPGASHSRDVIVKPQFRGPPNSGNGGYVCGLMAAELEAPVVTVVLRAPIAIDTPLRLSAGHGAARLTSLPGDLIAEARAVGSADLPPTTPAPPKLQAAVEAARGFVGLERAFHPICFTCAAALDEGYGLRVFVGPVEGDTQGLVAGTWTVHPNFADANGLAGMAAIWAALDCPGSVAWVARGGGGGLLGTMTGQVLRRPGANETCIVTAWPIEATGRKSIAGTALYSPLGELMARSRQVWIGRAPVA